MNRLPMTDPLVGQMVEFQRDKGCHWNLGKVSRELGGGFYDVVEVTRGRIHRRDGSVVEKLIFGRHRPVREACIRTMS